MGKEKTLSWITGLSVYQKNGLPVYRTADDEWHSRISALRQKKWTPRVTFETQPQGICWVYVRRAMDP